MMIVFLLLLQKQKLTSNDQRRSLVRGVGAEWLAACQRRRRLQGQVVVARPENASAP